MTDLLMFKGLRYLVLMADAKHLLSTGSALSNNTWCSSRLPGPCSQCFPQAQVVPSQQDRRGCQARVAVCSSSASCQLALAWLRYLCIAGGQWVALKEGPQSLHVLSRHSREEDALHALAAPAPPRAPSSAPPSFAAAPLHLPTHLMPPGSPLHGDLSSPSGLLAHRMPMHARTDAARLQAGPIVSEAAGGAAAMLGSEPLLSFPAVVSADQGSRWGESRRQASRSGRPGQRIGWAGARLPCAWVPAVLFAQPGGVQNACRNEGPDELVCAHRFGSASVDAEEPQCHDPSSLSGPMATKCKPPPACTHVPRRHAPKEGRKQTHARAVCMQARDHTPHTDAYTQMHLLTVCTCRLNHPDHHKRCRLQPSGAWHPS